MSDTNRILAEYRRQAEEAAIRLETALKVAGVAPLVSLSPDCGRGLVNGPHVYLGGCNAYVANALADRLLAHARCTGRLHVGVAEVAAAIPGEPPYRSMELNSRSTRRGLTA